MSLWWRRLGSPRGSSRTKTFISPYAGDIRNKSISVYIGPEPQSNHCATLPDPHLVLQLSGWKLFRESLKGKVQPGAGISFSELIAQNLSVLKSRLLDVRYPTRHWLLEKYHHWTCTHCIRGEYWFLHLYKKTFKGFFFFIIKLGLPVFGVSVNFWLTSPPWFHIRSSSLKSQFITSHKSLLRGCSRKAFFFSAWLL